MERQSDIMEEVNYDYLVIVTMTDEENITYFIPAAKLIEDAELAGQLASYIAEDLVVDPSTRDKVLLDYLGDEKKHDLAPTAEWPIILTPTPNHSLMVLHLYPELY